MKHAALSGLTLLASTTLAQTQVRDDARHFTMDIPAGWVASDELLNATNTLVVERVPDVRFTYFAAYVPEGSTGRGLFPYVLMQWTALPLEGVTYEALEASFDAATWDSELHKGTAGVRDLVGDLKAGQPVLDRSTNRMYVGLQASGGDVGGVSSMSVGFLTREGVVQINCYAPDGSGVDPAVQVQPFVDGFRLDEDARFVPAEPSSPLKTAAKNGLSGAARGAIIGASVGALFGAVTWLRNRAKKQAA